MDLVAALMRESGPAKECEVAHLLEDIGRELTRTAGTGDPSDFGDLDVHRLVRRIVVCNWIEDIEDIHLVDDWHWKEWEIPEKVASRLRKTAQEQAEAKLADRMSCCIQPVNFIRELVRGSS